MSEQENKGKLNIELPEEVATGVYANLAVITHSPAEFVMDFIQVMPGMPKAKVDEFGVLLAREAAAGHGRMYGYNSPGATDRGQAAGGGRGVIENVRRLAGVARRANMFHIGIVVTGVLSLYAYSKLSYVDMR